MKRTFPSVIGPAAALLALLGMASAAWLLYRNFTDWRHSESEVRQVQASIRSSSEIYSLVLTAESAARAYMITGRQADLEPYDRSLDALGREVMALRRAVKGRQAQSELADKLAGLVRDRRAAMNDTVMSRGSKGFSAARLGEFTSRGSGLTARIDRAVDEIQAEARHELAAWERQAAAGSARRVWLLSGIFLLSFLSMALALAALLKSSRRRRAAEAALSGSRALLDGVMALAGRAAFVAADAAGRITYLSPGAVKLLGWTPEEAAGKNMMKILHPPGEVAALAAELSARLGRPVEGFGVFTEAALQAGQAARDWNCLRRDGTACPVKLALSPLKDDAGGLAGVLLLAMERSPAVPRGAAARLSA